MFESSKVLVVQEVVVTSKFTNLLEYISFFLVVYRLIMNEDSKYDQDMIDSALQYFESLDHWWNHYRGFGFS